MQGECLLLGRCRPHPEAHDTTVEGTTLLGVKTLFCQRNTCDPRHTCRGATPPEGRWPWLTHTVLWIQRSKTAKAILSRAKRNLQCTGSRNHHTYLNSCAAHHLLRVQPMVKNRKAEVGRRKDIYMCKYLPICLCSSFT